MLIEQTKTKPQETLEFKMNKQMQSFSFNPPINLVEKGKWLLGVTSFECANSVFNITDENNSFAISTPGYWIPEKGQQTIDKLKELLELDKRDLSLHIAAVRGKGQKIHREDGNDLSDLDNSLLRSEIFEKIKETNILSPPKCLQMWMTVKDASMLTWIKMHKVSTPISMKVHSVCLLVLLIFHTINIEILKIWSIDYN